MNNNQAAVLKNQTPKWLLNLLPLISIIVGGGALWLTWFRYTSMLNRPDTHWYNWIQLALMTLVGILCLSATLLFMLGKSSGQPVFKAGLSIIPLILFSNLVMLIFRVLQEMIQGNAISFISRLYVSPLNKAILAVAVILTLLSIVQGTKKQ